MVNTRSSNNNNTNNTSRRTNGRATMIDGRLIHETNNTNNNNNRNTFYRQQHAAGFSWYRFFIILSLVSIVWFTNPPNLIPIIQMQQQQKQQSSSSLVFSSSKKQKYKFFPSTVQIRQYPKYVQNRKYYRTVTNYGFFSLIEGYSKMSIIGFTGYELLSLQCNYNTNNDIQTRICEYIRTNYCHEGPLLYHSSNNYNRAYTYHRIICWTILLLALYANCYHRPYLLLWTTNNNNNNTVWNLLYEALVSIFVDVIPTTILLATKEYYSSSRMSSSPIIPIMWSAIWNIFYNTIFVYPTLDRMNDIVPIQHPKSIFRIFTQQHYGMSDDSMNFFISFSSLLSIAIATNALSKIWSYDNYCTLKYHAFIAVCIGYYRGTYIFQSDDNNNNSFLWENGPSLTTITWIMFLLLLRKTSFADAILWLVAYFLGSCMGQYQYENIYIVASISNLWNAIQSSVQSASTTIESLLNEFQRVYYNYNNNNNYYYYQQQQNRF